MTWPKNILVVFNGSPNSTSGRLFSTLAEALGHHSNCDLDSNPELGMSLGTLLKGIRTNLARFKKIARSDLLILHSYLVFSLPSIIFARVVGTRVMVFQWDVYPSTINGRSVNRSRPRAVFDWIEARILKLANTVVVPSTDFLPSVEHTDVRTMPIWPTEPAETRNGPSPQQPSAGEPWRLCFAGQVTPLRALDSSIEHIRSISLQPFELHIFSNDPAPKNLCDQADIHVVHHGFLPPDQLKKQLSEMHFGLISLHKNMDQPGFPSKIVDMISAGLPVLYVGPPLPGFTSYMESSGVGLDVTSEKTIDLKAIHESLTSDFAQSREKYVASTELDVGRLSAIILETNKN